MRPMSKEAAVHHVRESTAHVLPGRLTLRHRRSVGVFLEHDHKLYTLLEFSSEFNAQTARASNKYALSLRHTSMNHRYKKRHSL